ncbi:MAG: dNTP triphosphohydrolase, partial [Alphaproteobacteria bacterium]|nr:dNTP triphosphohydrolase [Alphaproteobacteria bacterium]
MANSQILAPYASCPELSRGRLFDEPESATRTAFQRDRDRIIHSGAFRRLQYKTQVFVYHEGDHYRTRLTHSLEVAQIARSICRALDLNEDLAEALALAHDLGHTPFGHAGEDVLDGLMQPHGGFDHNAQALRVITLLEHRYADFAGLNLTWETLEGTVKHNGPVLDDPLPLAITEYVARQDLELATYAGPEAQVAALADDIAYDNHDIDDGLRAELFSAEDLAQVPLVAPVLAELWGRYQDLSREQLVHETVRRLIGAMVDDVIGESRGRLLR